MAIAERATPADQANLRCNASEGLSSPEEELGANASQLNQIIFPDDQSPPSGEGRDILT
jgi:hypothetical protein